MQITIPRTTKKETTHFPHSLKNTLSSNNEYSISRNNEYSISRNNEYSISRNNLKYTSLSSNKQPTHRSTCYLNKVGNPVKRYTLTPPTHALPSVYPIFFETLHINSSIGRTPEGLSKFYMSNNQRALRPFQMYPPNSN